jgi:hypothetical protein
MTTITVSGQHRGTIVARNGVLESVRMTRPPQLMDGGLFSLGDRAGDDQPLRALFSRMVKEKEFGWAPAMAFTELTLLHIPSGATFELEVKPLP